MAFDNTCPGKKEKQNTRELKYIFEFDTRKYKLVNSVITIGSRTNTSKFRTERLRRNRTTAGTQFYIIFEFDEFYRFFFKPKYAYLKLRHFPRNPLPPPKDNLFKFQREIVSTTVRNSFSLIHKHAPAFPSSSEFFKNKRNVRRNFLAT